MARRLVDMLDPGRSAALGEAARKVAERFSIEAHVSNVETHYRQVLEAMSREVGP